MPCSANPNSHDSSQCEYPFSRAACIVRIEIINLLLYKDASLVSANQVRFYALKYLIVLSNY